jgi:DNA (cytosine-5)-methyltransferase 1
METVAFCEIDPFARAVLKKHWPDVPCNDDVAARPFAAGEADIICGGFPCQDVSGAWRGPGLSGPRSGLYRHLVDAIRLVRPRYAIMENVAALLGRGMGTVLGDLAEIGHDAEWHCIPAGAVDAPHERDRVWIVAHPDRERRDEVEQPEHGRPACKGPIAPSLHASFAGGRRWWEAEPDVGRVADGVPSRVDRIRCLGNAVVAAKERG